MRITILLDSLKVNQWVLETIDNLRRNNQFKVVQIVLNDRPDKKSASSSLFYRILRYVDRKLFPVTQDPFQKVHLEPDDIPIIHATPIETKFSDKFSNEDLLRIREANPDVIIRFGFRIIRGDILNAAPCGVFSLHHGDTKSNRGGPPAFWEVVNRHPVTAVTLQRLNERLDGGVVLGKAFQRTDTTSFHRNQVKLYRAGVELMLFELKQLSAKGGLLYFQEKLSYKPDFNYHAPLYRNPGNLRSLCILTSHLFHSFSRSLIQLFSNRQWQILIGRHSGSWENFVWYRTKQLIPPLDRIWADPFIIKHGSGYAMFFEEKFNKQSKAHIAFWQLDTKGKPEGDKPAIVLEEDFHLSYPFILEHGGDFFMCPEAAESEKVILYKALDFPGNWQPYKVLLEGIRAYDPTLIHHEAKWYIFCTQQLFQGASTDMYLHIYYSDYLEGPYSPHPQNPVYRNVRLSRPAGRIFKDTNGKLIRPAQICAPLYGNGLVFFEIITLTTSSFEEQKIFEVKPDWDPKIRATHTFNVADELVVGDCQVNRMSLPFGI